MDSRRLLASGHTYQPLEDEEQEEMKANFLAYKQGLNRLTPGNWILPEAMMPFMDKIYSFKFRPTDIVLITYPKCGTTWTHEILWTIMNNPNLDNPKATLSIDKRGVFLEMDSLMIMAMGKPSKDSPMVETFNKLCPGRDPEDGILLQMAELEENPRIIKCHFPLSLYRPSLIDMCKIVYVARNPNDVCLSYQHHSRLLKNFVYKGTQDKFIDYFVTDKLMFGPYGEHLNEAWGKRDHKNMHFIFYEDMKMDPTKAIEGIDKFLGTNLTPKQISNVVEHTSFSSMKSSGSILDASVADIMMKSVLKKDGGFFRKGEVGSWKEKLTEEQEAKIKKWTKENVAEIPFKYC